jgi:hypothetical protein
MAPDLLTRHGPLLQKFKALGPSDLEGLPAEACLQMPACSQPVSSGMISPAGIHYPGSPFLLQPFLQHERLLVIAEKQSGAWGNDCKAL